MHQAICKPCADKARGKGFLVHDLPPYLLYRYNKIRCYLCGEKRFHFNYLNMELRNHPRKVREVR